MENKICQKCAETTQHRNEPIANPLSDEATMQTCLQCGETTIVIPYIESLTINVKTPPVQLNDSVIMSNIPHEPD